MLKGNEKARNGRKLLKNLNKITTNMLNKKEEGQQMLNKCKKKRKGQKRPENAKQQAKHNDQQKKTKANKC